MTVSYDILAIACLNLLCVPECMHVSMCIYVYVCMYDVRHDIQIPCTRYVAINRLYLLSLKLTRGAPTMLGQTWWCYMAPFGGKMGIFRLFSCDSINATYS